LTVLNCIWSLQCLSLRFYGVRGTCFMYCSWAKFSHSFLFERYRRYLPGSQKLESSVHIHPVVDEIKRDNLDWACEKGNSWRVLVGNPQVNRQLRRPGRGWEDNIQKYIKVIWRENVDWINLAQDRDKWRAAFKAIMNLPFT
jgi:hypothetical protein